MQLIDEATRKLLERYIHIDAPKAVFDALRNAPEVEQVGSVVDPTYAHMPKQLPYGTTLYAIKTKD